MTEELRLPYRNGILRATIVDDIENAGLYIEYIPKDGIPEDWKSVPGVMVDVDDRMGQVVCFFWSDHTREECSGQILLGCTDPDNPMEEDYDYDKGMWDL